jgi:O-antigen ligase
MVKTAPLTGVGPYQWNILRYEYEPDSPQLVANPHNAYVQLAAEFGVPTMIGYVLLLLAVGGSVAATQFRSGSTTSRAWSASLLVGCAAAYPITELTNSHLLNVRLGAVGWIILGTALAFALADRDRLQAAKAEATIAS